ncbi:amino acid adenylation domain-containing protein [Streptomyces sp. NPDC003247]|uniref:amino acid adenylation domain-containing protein n=1 Tax=Streptomyces sp. NPDC003247 TaxID=3364677 RepID=UPI00368D54EE
MSAEEIVEHTSLVELFDGVTDRNPHAPAVTDADGSVTYRELGRRSLEIAEKLVVGGATENTLIGLRVGRNIETVASILGILRAGAAYVPLDPTYPAERLRFMLEDSGARLLLDASGPGDAVLTALDETDRAAGADTGAVRVAYVAYTSGSTGRPKGCVITHDNVLAFLSGTLPLFDLSGTDRWTVVHSLSFDASVWELWGALATGATACLVPSEVIADPVRFVELVTSAEVTVVSLVTSYFKFVLDACKKSRTRPTGLRHLFFVGEAIRLDLVRDFLSLPEFSAVTTANMYGPTETTVFASAKVVTKKDTENGPRSPIGAALLNAELMITDGSGRRLPDGEAGEITIGGATVGHGYLGRADLTQERFPTRDGQRFYRTGDLGRRLPDGGFEYLGRMDQQIKRRGFRIEVEEIEQVLREETTVEDVVVCLCAAGAAEFLVACVVPRDGSADGLTDVLRARAKRLLPAVMCPDKYLLLPRLPYNDSGKLDRFGVQRSAQEALTGAARS